MTTDAAHQRELLAAHLRRLLTLDETLAQRPDEVSLALQRDQTASAIATLTATLGLAPLPDGLAASALAVGLRDHARASLERQQQHLTAHRRACELQVAVASPANQVTLTLALQQTHARLAEVARQLELLRTLPPAASNPPPVTPVRPPMTMLTLSPAQQSRLRALLARCDELASNADLRTLFNDARLALWRAGLAETDSLKTRVERLIDYMRDKCTTAGQHGLVLLLTVLAAKYEPANTYEPADARHDELLALLHEVAPLNVGTPATPSPTTEVSIEGSRRAQLNLPIAELQRAVACARAVAQISLTRTLEGVQRGVPTGTAWLIAPELAITCWHVIHARRPDDRTAEPEDLVAQLQHCLLTFAYTEAGQGRDYSITTLEYAHRDETGLDYALLRLRDRADAPLAHYGVLPLDLAPALTPLTQLYLLQHPGGEPQQQADGTFVRTVEQRIGRIHYTNHTAGGASGAPVINRTGWRVVALHHGTSADDFGEGILLSAILHDLQQQRPDLVAVIHAAQPTV